jgi:hypothetical protein
MVGDRPSCLVDKEHKIHRHATYERNGDCDDRNPLRVLIERFLCVPCGRTISVLPEAVLPYRAVPAPLVEKHFDAQANGTPEPPSTEKEKGCLKRAWASFNRRVESLVAVLGQMISRVKPSATELWCQLRQRGNLEAILRWLANPFKTSLLHDYRCLKSWRP